MDIHFFLKKHISNSASIYPKFWCKWSKQQYDYTELVEQVHQVPHQSHWSNAEFHFKSLTANFSWEMANTILHSLLTKAIRHEQKDSLSFLTSSMITVNNPSSWLFSLNFSRQLYTQFDCISVHLQPALLALIIANLIASASSIAALMQRDSPNSFIFEFHILLHLFNCTFASNSVCYFIFIQNRMEKESVAVIQY